MPPRPRRRDTALAPSSAKRQQAERNRDRNRAGAQLDDSEGSSERADQHARDHHHRGEADSGQQFGVTPGAPKRLLTTYREHIRAHKT